MRQWIEKNKPYFPAEFFIAGFLFDLITLSRIDESVQLLQQFVYLVVIGFLLIFEKSKRVEHWFTKGFLNKVWIYRYEIIHFLLGSLLSIYTIFYFKSASIWNSFLFIGGLSALMVLNEFEKIKGLGGILRFGMFSLCSCSYFIYLVPIVWQHLGFFTFLFSLILSGIFYYFFFYLVSKYEHLSSQQLLKEVLAPGIVVHVLFFVFYVIGFIPPIPLSIEKIGIYHQISKQQDEYQLQYDRDWWRFWEKGAQTFVAGPQDKIHCFVSIFAPRFFREQVKMEWWMKGAKGWLKTDSIPFQISGGRDQGFRGYTVKSFFDPGSWQVRVLTSDDRELGRIYFTVEKRPDLISHEMKTEAF
jgi:hypothetical protein